MLTPLANIEPKSYPNCTILDSWVFDNFILADELSAQALWSTETCPSLNNNNLCGKLVSSVESPTTFDEILKLTSVSCFLPDFSWVVNYYIESFSINTILKQNRLSIITWFLVKILKWFLKLFQ